MGEVQLNKTKYTKKEVEDLIREERANNTLIVNALKEKNNALINENKRLSLLVEEYNNNQSYIENCKLNAEKDAEKKREESEELYNIESQSLKKFFVIWKDYFDYLQETYPFYPQIKAMRRIEERVEQVINNKDLKRSLNDISGEIKEQLQNNNKFFKPMDKINNYFSAKEKEDSFNMDEVLHPGDIDLGDICKELGLIEDEK